MAGSLTNTSSDLGGGITKYNIAWVSDASGVVSLSVVEVKRGRLIQIKYVPDAGGTQPSDLYDMTLPDTNGVDVLAGDGANLSNANSKITAPTAPILLEAGNLTPTIASAGNAKGGTLILFVGP